MIIGTPPFERIVTVELLQELLPISKATAYRYWRTGKIPDTALELLTLKILGKVIPESKQWQGFRFGNQDNKLWSDTDYSFSANQLAQHHFLYNETHYVKKENNHLKEYVNYLEAVKPRATVTKIEDKKPRPSMTIGKENNRLFHKD